MHAGLGSSTLGGDQLIKESNLISDVFLGGRNKEEALTPDTAVTTKQRPTELKESEGLPHLKWELMGETGIFPLRFSFSTENNPYHYNLGKPLPLKAGSSQSLVCTQHVLSKRCSFLSLTNPESLPSVSFIPASWLIPVQSRWPSCPC